MSFKFQFTFVPFTRGYFICHMSGLMRKSISFPLKHIFALTFRNVATDFACFKEMQLFTNLNNKMSGHIHYSYLKGGTHGLFKKVKETHIYNNSGLYHNESLLH